MPKSSTSPKPLKPAKPRRDFPLTAHPNGQWSKKILGRPHYFGVWANPAEAEAKWDEQKADLLAGRKPRPRRDDAVTLKHLCNHFMDSKERARLRGAIAARTLKRYLDTCGFLIEQFGEARYIDDLRPDDFAELSEAMAKRWGPTSPRGGPCVTS